MGSGSGSTKRPDRLKSGPKGPRLSPEERAARKREQIIRNGQRWRAVVPKTTWGHDGEPREPDFQPFQLRYHGWLGPGCSWIRDWTR